jgi:hypothetical protein
VNWEDFKKSKLQIPIFFEMGLGHTTFNVGLGAVWDF